MYSLHIKIIRAIYTAFYIKFNFNTTFVKFPDNVVKQKFGIK